MYRYGTACERVMSASVRRYSYSSSPCEAAAARAQAALIPRRAFPPNLVFCVVPSCMSSLPSIVRWSSTLRPMSAGASMSLMPAIARSIPPSASRSSFASCEPVDAADGTENVPRAASACTVTWSVGFPRESLISSASILVMRAISFLQEKHEVGNVCVGVSGHDDVAGLLKETIRVEVLQMHPDIKPQLCGLPDRLRVNNGPCCRAVVDAVRGEREKEIALADETHRVEPHVLASPAAPARARNDEARLAAADDCGLRTCGGNEFIYSFQCLIINFRADISNCVSHCRCLLFHRAQCVKIRDDGDVLHSLEEYLFFRRLQEIEVFENAVLLENGARVLDSGRVAERRSGGDRLILATGNIAEYEPDDRRRVEQFRETAAFEAGDVLTDGVQFLDWSADA